MAYPEHILRYLRQRQGLAEGDTSMDDRLNAIPPKKAFREVLEWHGMIGGWDSLITGWIKDIYGVDVEGASK